MRNLSNTIRETNNARLLVPFIAWKAWAQLRLRIQERLDDIKMPLETYISDDLLSDFYLKEYRDKYHQ